MTEDTVAFGTVSVSLYDSITAAYILLENVYVCNHCNGEVTIPVR